MLSMRLYIRLSIVKLTSWIQIKIFVSSICILCELDYNKDIFIKESWFWVCIEENKEVDNWSNANAINCSCNISFSFEILDNS